MHSFLVISGDLVENLEKANAVNGVTSNIRVHDAVSSREGHRARQIPDYILQNF